MCVALFAGGLHEKVGDGLGCQPLVGLNQEQGWSALLGRIALDYQIWNEDATSYNLSESPTSR